MFFLFGYLGHHPQPLNLSGFLPPDLGEFSLPGWFLMCFLCGGFSGHLGVMRSSQVGRCFCIGTIAHGGAVFQWGKGMMAVVNEEQQGG